MHVILLLALLGSVFAAPKSDHRIVGGTVTTVEEYPYMANMQYGWYGVVFMHWCGGTLLTNLAILSAAQCFYGDTASWWRVRLGTSIRESGGLFFAVSRITEHPQYNQLTYNADVAIVHLARAAVYANNIQAAHIAGPNYPLAEGTPVVAIGWGDTMIANDFCQDLKRVTLNVINQQLCAERYAYLKTQPGYTNWPDVVPTMFCAGILDVGGRDTCLGDEGGPISITGGTVDVVVGITSWGFGCGTSFYPGVLTRVSSYTDWIVSVAESV